MVDISSNVPYSAPTYSIRTTEVFDTWFAGLQDRVARRRIQARIDRLSMGNPGDWKSAGSPVVEMRIDDGPGYRVYYVRRATIWVILLCGGDKSTQQADIRAAHAMLGRLDLE
ncbi:TPA: type II toxin-antitoxin system RelE/ParE family toxin [Burkholderia vietnamiensis]|uniref:Type II toxin-antitoxin system RelE/ParE family toxin n=1 Tax=Burkholderia vietnamiensis TaxID=60552 RepID=A0A132DSZ6_BURVI|nr:MULTISPECIES: type II toxin-antitoxin system RelE/ParE family toxin [Burkholderia]KVS07516.1 addiction module protein [Burkholderia vietnamiensis]MBE0631668.1 type II toxin-antitoxin system RelE/ParE family toxin [Burkholderia vietnamiensis]MCA8208189.1 type II toxin-antitoxin system RelE/ParE family toxin [Burkholderia vietnamiensis]PRH41117.1 type II toxin-antitoxin system RelE/ParE family toxin [Burkholderia vietnamiensis]TCT33666.1 putative addiction module killer protein [Burkholderia 